VCVTSCPSKVNPEQDAGNAPRPERRGWSFRRSAIATVRRAPAALVLVARAPRVPTSLTAWRRTPTPWSNVLPGLRLRHGRLLLHGGALPSVPMAASNPGLVSLVGP